MLSCCIFLGHVGKASLGAVWPPGLRHTLRKSCRIYMMESPCNQLVGKSTQSLWGHECLLCVCREFPHWLSCSSVGAYLCILHCWRPFHASDSHCRSALMLCRVSDPVRRMLMFVTKTQLPKEESVHFHIIKQFLLAPTAHLCRQSIFHDYAAKDKVLTFLNHVENKYIFYLSLFHMRKMTAYCEDW